MTGIPSCKKCGGRGFIEAISDDPRQPPSFDECDCTRKMAIIRNLERGWKGLVKATNIDETPLLAHTRQNLRITATQEVFRSHLRRAGIEKGRRWGFKVVTDADLVRAWLSNVPDGPRGMMSADGEWVSLDHYSHTPLVDLIDPPQLLIVCLWEQVAKNSQMPNVLAQTLLQRDHNSKPVWVVDTPLHSFREGHRCYSPEMAALMSGWGHLDLTNPHNIVTTVVPTPAPPAPTEEPKKKTKSQKKRPGRKKKDSAPPQNDDPLSEVEPLEDLGDLLDTTEPQAKKKGWTRR